MLIAFIAYMLTATPAQAAELPVLDAQVCQALAIHQPGIDGSAEYEPGVDVNGKPVVEADLNNSGIVMADTITFPLSVDMAQYLGISVSPVPEGQIALGTVAVPLKGGSVTLNGEPLEGQAEAALRALCLEKEPLQKAVKPAYNP